MVLMSIMEMSVLEGFFRNKYLYYIILFFSVSCFNCLLSVRIINAIFFFGSIGGGKVGLITSFKI